MRVTILGLPFDLLTQDQAVERICGAALQHHKLKVATINPEFVMAAHKDSLFFQTLNQADIALADGIGILWAANINNRLIANPGTKLLKRWVIAIEYGFRTFLSVKFRTAIIPQQVSGSNLVTQLASEAAKNELSVFLLGGSGDVAYRAAEKLRQMHPDLRISGTFSGDGSEAGDAQTRQVIIDHPADILLVAYGAPKQEQWIARNLADIPVSVAIGVGGTFSFLAGDLKRAPKWVQKLGFEWLFRLILEPWRWRRQLALPKFIAAVVKADAYPLE